MLQKPVGCLAERPPFRRSRQRHEPQSSRTRLPGSAHRAADVIVDSRRLSENPLCGPSLRARKGDSTHGRGTINVPVILSYTSNDWGWWRTVSGNLDKLAQFAATELTDADMDIGHNRAVRHDPAAQVATLRAAIDGTPKSTRWKLRARVGERITWYAEPEEVGHGPE